MIFLVCLFVSFRPLVGISKDRPSPEDQTKDRPSLEDQTNVVYKINCADCSWSYIGETGRAFNTRRKEHVRNVELCKSGSNIASHAWTNNHKIDFNGKIIDKGTFDTEERLSHVTLHAQKAQITIQNIYRINTAFYLGKNFKYSIIVT